MADSATISDYRGQAIALTAGYWSALLATGLTVAFVVLAFAFAPAPWEGIHRYAANFRTIQMASFVPVLLLAPAMVVLMASLHTAAPAGLRYFSLIGLIFTAIYAAIICTNYYLQLFVVRLNLLHGNLEGLALLAMPNLRSAFFALEAIGYSFLSLATLAVSPMFTGSRLATWIRWLFVGNGALGMVGVVVALLDQPAIIFAALGLWNIIFPVATLLVGLYFRNARSRLPAVDPSLPPAPNAERMAA